MKFEIKYDIYESCEEYNIYARDNVKKIKFYIDDKKVIPMEYWKIQQYVWNLSYMFYNGNMDREEYDYQMKMISVSWKEGEDALAIAGKPYSDSNCKCCDKIYIPSNHDSVICRACCTTCYYDKDKYGWVRGHLCPAYKSGTPGSYRSEKGNIRVFY